MPTISGVVSYRARVALPPGAVVRVRLEDVALQDAPAVLVAEFEVVTQGEQVPIPFALDADLTSTREHARLALRAAIEVDGELRFTTTSQHALTDATEDIQLVVDPVGAAPRPSLGGTAWRLVELNGEPVEIADGAPVPNLLLDLEESQVAGSGGCNRLTGTFALSESELRFGAARDHAHGMS